MRSKNSKTGKSDNLSTPKHNDRIQKYTHLNIDCTLILIDIWDEITYEKYPVITNHMLYVMLSKGHVNVIQVYRILNEHHIEIT